MPALTSTVLGKELLRVASGFLPPAATSETLFRKGSGGSMAVHQVLRGLRVRMGLASGVAQASDVEYNAAEARVSEKAQRLTRSSGGCREPHGFMQGPARRPDRPVLLPLAVPLQRRVHAPSEGRWRRGQRRAGARTPAAMPARPPPKSFLLTGPCEPRHTPSSGRPKSGILA
jgi:hypothetical protein